MQTIRTFNGLHLAENDPSQNKRCRAQRGNGGKSTALDQAKRSDLPPPSLVVAFHVQELLTKHADC